MGSLPKKRITVDLSTGELLGSSVQYTVRTVKDLQGIFRDEAARPDMDPDQPIYQVQAFLPAPEGQEGELFWGATFIEPGLAGDEYFMTKGHFHADRSRTEFYLTIQAYVHRHAWTPWSKVEFRRAQLGNEAGLHGAIPLLEASSGR